MQGHDRQRLVSLDYSGGFRQAGMQHSHHVLAHRVTDAELRRRQRYLQCIQQLLQWP
jgi:hypothetical protein